MRNAPIFFPNCEYRDALLLSGLERLSDRRENLVKTLFEEIKCDNHVLHSLLQHRTISTQTRNSYPFILPNIKTSRSRRDFISYCLFKNY